ncbi:uncharacterized protein BCR38DRAFT_410238 [Pseudomassariella vexata]|uniref:Uncharacterized protein n=1 Tax=Pseudomassariella vexata TaxID=1141098 RepID=A0A1Y2DVL7_9PEZI|nr:uncharacterized protein BCR38DRAFT_410238 [Pseudomassariella vexata]ORY63298.1 hypothetical protein BCR38DRAFT_410238 [Pseudomassariella vexata]
MAIFGFRASPRPDASNRRKRPLEDLSESLADAHDSNRDMRALTWDRDAHCNKNDTHIVEILPTREMQLNLFCRQSDSGIRNNTDTDDNNFDHEQSHPGMIQHIAKPNTLTDSTDLRDLIDPALRCPSFSEDLVQTLEGPWHEHNDIQMHQDWVLLREPGAAHALKMPGASRGRPFRVEFRSEGRDLTDPAQAPWISKQEVFRASESPALTGLIIQMTGWDWEGPW